jgi:hypothetical protein
MATITDERLKNLERAEMKLRALEIGGVDNWAHYDIAMEQYHKEIDFEDSIDDLVNEVSIALLDGCYEPSERGAGYAATDKAMAAAKDLVVEFIRNRETTNND